MPSEDGDPPRNPDRGNGVFTEQLRREHGSAEAMGSNLSDGAGPLHRGTDPTSPLYPAIAREGPTFARTRYSERRDTLVTRSRPGNP